MRRSARLYGNNEPLLDTGIVEKHRYAREKLPESFIFMSTNGLLLTLDRIREVQPYIDQLIINNYAEEYKLHDNIRQIYDYVRTHEEEFRDIEIIIQMRYLQEVLTNRAGSSPNKKATEKVYTKTCLLPFTDLWITPNGHGFWGCKQDAAPGNLGGRKAPGGKKGYRTGQRPVSLLQKL